MSAPSRQLTIGGLILAGGQNRRMGGLPKAALRDSAGVRFLDRIAGAMGSPAERLLSTNTPALAEGTSFTPVPDRFPDTGPLGGIASALLFCRSDGLLTVSCDVPLVTPELFDFLRSFQDRGWPAWAVEDRTGRLHPLCGVYTKECLSLLLSQLDQGQRRVTRFFQSVGGQVVSLAGTSIPDTALANVNTPEEWDRLRTAGNL